jgi:DNA end-binding protein Ku
MASTVWKGYLTFGLISVPVRLFVAARTERISFNQIHEKCGSRIKQQTWCPVCERVVERNELKKGFEVAKGRFVIVEDEEIKKIAPQSSETMEILEFVRGADIDPIYFDSSYFMVPEDAGKKAYELLFQTMEKSGFSAIAKIAMHQREYTVVIRPHGHGLTLHTMFYPEEVRAVPEYGSSDNIQIRPQEVSLAEKLVEGLAADFDPSKYHDEYQSQLSQLIEAKKEGLEVQSTAPKRLAPVIDLMQALQQSLGQMPQKKPASKVTTMEPETAEQPRKKQRAKAAR